MTITQYGQLNTAALIVPDLFVQIVPPQSNPINGVPTNILGIVGTASWGPKNAPATVGSYGDYAAKFGPLMARKYDAGTQVALAAMQGAGNMRVVRVTDGTDTAATVVVLTNCITFTGFYTGSDGNKITVTISVGSAASSKKATIFKPGLLPEVFDNITGSANAFWVNLATAINNGVSTLRGPSKIITATAGVGTTASANATYTLATGTDGAGVAASDMIGVDSIPRTGMYALRGTRAKTALLADVDDTTVWSTQAAYALSEGTYMMLVSPAGDTISSFASAVATAGLDTYAVKQIFGDWVIFKDTVNNQTRAVSPQGVFGGLRAALSPEQSLLNKQVFGIVGTQKSALNQIYSAAELQQIAAVNGDLITNPVPGGAYFGVRLGRNASSNQAIHGDNYTSMTNFLADTFNAGLGLFIGKVQTPTLRREAKSTVDGFLDSLWLKGMISNAQGTVPYQSTLDDSNNPPDRVALGYMQLDAKIQYGSIVEYFIVNVEGGQSVTITRAATQPA